MPDLKATRYHGKPCGRCGNTERHRTNRTCVVCHRARLEMQPAEWRALVYWRQDLKKRYGITEADYNRMMTEQGGLCKICRRVPRGKWPTNVRLGVDHDHATGKVRGLLCDTCNRGLGLFGDRADWLLLAAEYLCQS